MVLIVFDKVKNIAEKGENAFPTIFLKHSFSGSFKLHIMVIKTLKLYRTILTLCNAKKENQPGKRRKNAGYCKMVLIL